MQCALLVGVLYFTLYACSKSEVLGECTVSDVGGSECYVVLGDNDSLIDSSVYGQCSVNSSILSIRERNSNITRRLTTDLFFDYFLQLRHVVIEVNHLLIELGSFHTGRTSTICSLTMRNCGISSLPSVGALYGLSILEHIDLSQNHLTELPVDFSAHTPLLSSIDVSNNLLRSLVGFTGNTVHDNLRLVNVSGNPIDCTCENAWFLTKGKFVGLSNCRIWPQPCAPIMSVTASTSATAQNHSKFFVLAGGSLTLNCTVQSNFQTELLWFTPIGVIAPGSSSSNDSTVSYSYFVQPILAPTVLRISFMSALSEIRVENARGHLAGQWYCVVRSAFGLTVSEPVFLQVFSSMYSEQVYYLSLCYGYGAMLVLLLIGIIGGTIRYCSETRCMRRPQPPFAYGGKTFIGVIPVPEVDGESSQEKTEEVNTTYDLNEGSLRYVSTGRFCNICLKPYTYWFCNNCRAVHFAECLFPPDQVKQYAPGDVPFGEIASDGEIKLLSQVPPCATESESFSQVIPGTSTVPVLDAHEPLMPHSHGTHQFAQEVAGTDRQATSMSSDYVYVRSGDCMIKVRPSHESLDGSLNSTQLLVDSICLHSKQRPSSADVKLIVSNEKLAEEYRDALADLARAVESPDPAHFREHLEAFRSRLRRDVGHGVKVLRGEFRGLRAKSAKSVANLRSQSSAAAQKMRAGFSHGVQQVKGGMRSMAELCSRTGTIGQTISVVSVYVDETDQVRKERFISDFVF